jgi:hypothetical protein
MKNTFTEITFKELETIEGFEDWDNPAGGYTFKTVGGLKRSFNAFFDGKDGKKYECKFAANADKEFYAVYK